MKTISILFKVLSLIIVLVVIAGIFFLYKKDLKTSPELGSPVPDFNALTVSGKEFDLLKASDTATIYLSFLRFSSCPVCNFRVHELIENLPALEANNILTILIFETSRSDLKKYYDHYNIPIEMIPDPEKELYNLYSVEENLVKLTINSQTEAIDQIFEEGTELFYDGVQPEGTGSLGILPADFIIREGKFIRSQYGKHIADNIPVEDIIRIAQGLDF